MGGMGGMGGGQRGPTKGKDVGMKLKVPLEMFYNGETKEIEMPKTIKCKTCKGAGFKSGKSVKCMSCQGQGRKRVMRQMGPGMVQQMIQQCEACNGTGGAISDKDKCPKCQGKQMMDVDRTLKVKIEPGMKNGEQIPFRGEGDESPDYDIPGSIIILVEQEPHDHYERKGDDLYITKSITLVQALTGFVLEHEHMDTRILHIQSPKGEIIKPGDKKIVPGEGMKKRGSNGKGDLIITFKIEFPRMLDEDQIVGVRQGLPKAEKRDVDFGKEEEPEECFLDHYDVERWAEMNKMSAEEEEDMEEEGGGGGPGGMQCQHQ